MILANSSYTNLDLAKEISRNPQLPFEVRLFFEVAGNLTR